MAALCCTILLCTPFRCRHPLPNAWGCLGKPVMRNDTNGLPATSLMQMAIADPLLIPFDAPCVMYTYQCSRTKEDCASKYEYLPKYCSVLPCAYHIRIATELYCSLIALLASYIFPANGRMDYVPGYMMNTSCAAGIDTQRATPGSKGGNQHPVCDSMTEFITGVG